MSISAVVAQNRNCESVKLGDVLTLHYGKALPKSARNPTGKVPVYGANGVKDHADQALCNGPTLVIGRKGSAGEVTRVDGPFWPLDVTYYTSQDRERLDFDYMAYGLSMLDLPALARGVKPGINRNDVYALPVLLPPLEEQKRIVMVLDQAFAALDRARANAESNLADAAKLFESWLASAFEFGAEHWPTTTLPKISQNLDRSRVPITEKDRKSGDIPYYGASGVVDHVVEYLFNEELLLVSEDGANLLARIYPIAFSISGKSWVNNHAHVLRFDELVTQEFVRLYLNSISLEPYVSGMAQPKLNQGALNRIPVPYPETGDRKRIVAEAETIAANTDAARTNYEAQLAELAALRQSPLRKAFAGEFA